MLYLLVICLQVDAVIHEYMVLLKTSITINNLSIKLLNSIINIRISDAYDGIIQRIQTNTLNLHGIYTNKTNLH